MRSKDETRLYQKHAIVSCGKYIHHFHEDDELVDLYIEIMTNVLSDRYDSTDDDSDEEMDDEGDTRKLNAKENIELEEKKLKILNNVAVAFYTQPDINNQLFEFVFDRLVKIFQSQFIENTWRSKLKLQKYLRKY